MKVQDSLLKKINKILRISIFLVLSMSDFLQHQRHESTEKRGQINHWRKIGTQKRNTGITKNNTDIASIFLKNAM